MKNRVFLLLLSLCLLAVPALAQLGVSTISGRVTDASGAVIPGAVVTIVNTATGFTYTSETNSEGLFRVPSLQPGPYRVEIEAGGFKRFLRENLVLRAGVNLPVNTALEVGAVTEQIEVTAETPLLETESSAVGAAVTGEILYKLPNYQRYTASTMNFIPAITTGGYAYGGSLGNYHVAGQRSTAVGAFDDGVPTNDQDDGTSYTKPVLNAVEEVKVFSTALPAEYGHSAGGVMDIVKKTGTNQFHGLASLYGRSRRMQHRLFFDRDRTSTPQPGLPNGSAVTFFMPDFNLSGPVIRNKTFFLFAYQHLIEKKTAQAFESVPTAAMKAGDFSFGGIGNPIFDPATTERLPDGTWVRAPLQNNLVPLSRFDPASRKLIDLDPWVPQNLPDEITRSGPGDNLLYNENARVFFHDFLSRIDHQFNSNVKMFWSVSRNTSDGLGRPPRSIRLLEFDANEGDINPNQQETYSLGGTWIINPTMISDTRAGYTRRHSTRTVPWEGQDWPGRLGIPNVDPTFMPRLGNIFDLNHQGPRERTDETLSLRSDLTKISGAHAFKMGYEILRFRLNDTRVDYPSGDFSFGSMTTGLQANGQNVPNTGNDFAALLLGYVQSAAFDRELAMWQPRSSIQSFYFQDDWKATPNLTLNLGVRYSNESQFNTKYGLQANFDPTAIDPVTGLPGAIVHPTESLAGRDGNNFQPRIGIAWQFMPRWVMRAGFAVNTIDIKYPSSRGNFQEYVAEYVDERPPGDPRPVYRLSEVPAAPQYNIRSDGSAGFVGENPTSRSADWWPSDLKNAYAVNWNFGLQRELGSSYLLEVNYQGSSGVSLLQNWNINTFPSNLGENDPQLRAAAFAVPQNFRPFTHFGTINSRCNCGHSSYHSGTVRLEKRYGGTGLTFLTFYTWSKTINLSDSDNGGGFADPLLNRDLDKGLAGYHREHVWTGTVLYELPFGRGKPFLNTGGVMHHIFGGWEIAMIQTMNTGNPYNLDYAGNPANQFPTYVAARRPNAVQPNPKLRDNWRSEVSNSPDRFSKSNIAPVMDASFFGYPGAFTLGSLGRNVVIGPNLVWTQVSAQKNIDISERVKFQIRWDMQNAFKHYNFNTPENTYNENSLNQFAKVTSDPRTASIGGQPLMNLTLELRF